MLQTLGSHCICQTRFMATLLYSMLKPEYFSLRCGLDNLNALGFVLGRTCFFIINPVLTPIHSQFNERNLHCLFRGPNFDRINICFIQEIIWKIWKSWFSWSLNMTKIELLFSFFCQKWLLSIQYSTTLFSSLLCRESTTTFNLELAQIKPIELTLTLIPKGSIVTNEKVPDIQNPWSSLLLIPSLISSSFKAQWRNTGNSKLLLNLRQTNPISRFQYFIVN